MAIQFQYAFAADRENDEVAYLHQPLHPSILRALQQVFAAAEQLRCAVSTSAEVEALVQARLGSRFALELEGHAGRMNTPEAPPA